MGDEAFAPLTLNSLHHVLLQDGPEAFLERHDAPFLVGPPSPGANEDWSFKTRSMRTIRAIGGDSPALLDMGFLALAITKRIEGPFMDTVLLGRSQTNDIVLPAGGISKLHARLKRGDDYTINLFDAGSSNGTFVGNQQLQPDKGHLVQPGDVVSFGDHAFILFSPHGLLDILKRLTDA